ncbi:glycosyltransferase [Algibacter luteus]|uniref:glycosyltransferase n=1 Tax=Algibacter luteus TaxID=1178825 RepID=UPI00037075EE
MNTINNALIFVFRSNHKGFPNALAEALCTGTPCILTNYPHGLSEFIEHDTNGVLIMKQKIFSKKFFKLI